MATKWSKKKVNPDNINSGNEYEKGDRVSVQALNSMVESGLYSQEFAEAIVDTPDTSEAGNVGTPAVSFIDNVKNGATYKKFKFANIKGETGAKIVSTEFQGQDANGGNIYKQTFDNGSTAIFTAPKGAKGDSGSPYANTSEGQISGLNLNSSSTLADLATQLLAVQTRVVSAPIGNNITSANATALRRLLGGAPFNGTYERVEFKVFSQVTGFEKIIDVVGLKQSTSTPKIVHGQIVYNDAGEGYEWQWTGWSTEPHPVGSIYQSTSSTSPSSLFGGAWTALPNEGTNETASLIMTEQTISSSSFSFELGAGTIVPDEFFVVHNTDYSIIQIAGRLKVTPSSTSGGTVGVKFNIGSNIIKKTSQRRQCGFYYDGSGGHESVWAQIKTSGDIVIYNNSTYVNLPTTEAMWSVNAIFFNKSSDGDIMYRWKRIA